MTFYLIISNSEPNATSKSLIIFTSPAAMSVNLAPLVTVTFWTLMSPQLLTVVLVVTV
jgi:hypothetical protein